MVSNVLFGLMSVDGLAKVPVGPIRLLYSKIKGLKSRDVEVAVMRVGALDNPPLAIHLCESKHRRGLDSMDGIPSSNIGFNTKTLQHVNHHAHV